VGVYRSVQGHARRLRTTSLVSCFTAFPRSTPLCNVETRDCATAMSCQRAARVNSIDKRAGGTTLARVGWGRPGRLIGSLLLR